MTMKLQLFQKKKEYVLMHRKTPVLLFTCDPLTLTVTSMIET